MENLCFAPLKLTEEMVNGLSILIASTKKHASIRYFLQGRIPYVHLEEIQCNAQGANVTIRIVDLFQIIQ